MFVRIENCKFRTGKVELFRVVFLNGFASWKIAFRKNDVSPFLRIRFTIWRNVVGSEFLPIISATNGEPAYWLINGRRPAFIGPYLYGYSEHGANLRHVPEGTYFPRDTGWMQQETFCAEFVYPEEVASDSHKSR